MPPFDLFFNIPFDKFSDTCKCRIQLELGVRLIVGFG